MATEYDCSESAPPGQQRQYVYLFHDVRVDEMDRGKRHHKGLKPIAQIERAERQRRVLVYAERVENGEPIF